MNYFNQNLFITIVILVVTMNVDQTAYGLAGIRFVRHVVQNKSIWGDKSRQQQKSRFTPVQVLGLTVVDNTDDTNDINLGVTTATATATAATVEESFFDADSYRQEMTDLVFQRNMQRMNQ